MYKLTAFVFLLFTMACNPSQPVAPINTAAIFQLTKAANDRSLQGHIEKNVDKIIEVYTDDAVLLPPGEKTPVSGIAAIRAYYQKGLAPITSKAASTGQS